MSANKIRNDAWWLLKFYDYLLVPLNMSDNIRAGWKDFREVLEMKLEENARIIEELESKAVKSNQISLEIKEKPTSPLLGPSQPPSRFLSEPTTFLDIIQQTPPSFPTRSVNLSVAQMMAPASEPVKSPAKTEVLTQSVKVVEPAKSPAKPDSKVNAKVEVPIVLVTKADDEGEEGEKADDEAEEGEEGEEGEEAEEGEEGEEADGEVLTQSEEEEEEEENYAVIRVKRITYWHETNSNRVYKYISEDEVGDLVGKYNLLNGIPTISPA